MQTCGSPFKKLVGHGLLCMLYGCMDHMMKSQHKHSHDGPHDTYIIIEVTP